MGPWTVGDLMVLDKFPRNAVAAADAEEVSHRWTDVDARVAVGIGFGSFAFENVFPVVGAEWAAIFPLGVADLAAVVDGYPATFADG